jgi:predicted ATP-dependent serine protease
MTAAAHDPQPCEECGALTDSQSGKCAPCLADAFIEAFNAVEILDEPAEAT